MPKNENAKIVIDNRKARHDYTFLETFEAGIELRGTEVKSLRNNRANLQDSFAKIENGEAVLYNMHISPYEHGNRSNHEPTRPRRLLLHKNEINRLYAKVKEKGLTLVPTKVYFTHGLAKVEIALAQGKKLYDKRDALAAKESKREIDRAFKEKQRLGN